MVEANRLQASLATSLRASRCGGRGTLTLAVTNAIPLSLALGPCWELEACAVDSTTFLRSLPRAFPDATTLFVEGSSIASDVAEIYRQCASASAYPP